MLWTTLACLKLTLSLLTTSQDRRAVYVAMRLRAFAHIRLPAFSLPGIARNLYMCRRIRNIACNYGHDSLTRYRITYIAIRSCNCSCIHRMINCQTHTLSTFARTLQASFAPPHQTQSVPNLQCICKHLCTSFTRTPLAARRSSGSHH